MQTPQGYRWEVELAEPPQQAPPYPPEGIAADSAHAAAAAALQQTVELLRQELEARRREVQELHDLLQQAQAKALPPPKEALPWWRRLWRPRHQP